jgi:tyrosine-protein kinase Etk/Wzc
MNTATDSIDLRDVVRTVRRAWVQIAVFATIGGLVALATVLWAPRRFESAATVVVRSSPDLGGSLLSRIGDDKGLGGAAAGLFSAVRSPIETELQILASRSVVAEVVDSLRLQARVVSPSGVAPVALVEALELPGSFRKEKYRFDRKADGTFRVSGAGQVLTAAPGTPIRLPRGELTLAQGTLPESFTLQLLDEEDAVTRTQKRLRVGKAGGEVVRVTYRSPDSLGAALVPNAVVAAYLVRKRTSDRGVNRHKAEFLAAELDSVGQQLAAAENALRRHQEASGVIEPTVVGKLQLEQAVELRQALGELDMERGAVRQMIAQVASGGLDPRQIAAYPTFLKSGGLTPILDRMSDLEAKRLELLGNRTEEDPEVIALREGIREMEHQLLPLATTYSTILERQRSDLARQLDTMKLALAAFPAAAQSSVRLQRDVLRLGQIHALLQGQLVEARLAAIGEGGDIRALDVAEAPKKVAFPGTAATIGFGLGGGLLLGLVAALLSGAVGRYIDDPFAIERATGVPTLRLDAHAPLIFAGRPLSNTVLVVPLDSRADTERVAERLARTALSRALQPTILDLSGASSMSAASSVGATIDRLEQEYGMVIVRLPGLGSDEAAAALRETRPVLLVGPEQRLDRTRLMDAVQTLRRLDMPCAGVVLSGYGTNALVAG